MFFLSCLFAVSCKQELDNNQTDDSEDYALVILRMIKKKFHF